MIVRSAVGSVIAKVVSLSLAVAPSKIIFPGAVRTPSVPNPHVLKVSLSPEEAIVTP